MEILLTKQKQNWMPILGYFTLPQTMRNLEQCTRQLTRIMDLMPSDFTAVNSTLPATLFSSFCSDSGSGQKSQCGSKIDV